MCRETRDTDAAAAAVISSARISLEKDFSFPLETGHNGPCLAPAKRLPANTANSIRVARSRVLAPSDRWGEFTQPVPPVFGIFVIFISASRLH